MAMEARLKNIVCYIFMLNQGLVSQRPFRLVCNVKPCSTRDDMLVMNIIFFLQLMVMYV